MGNEESVQSNELPSELQFKENELVLVDQRDLLIEWKRSGMTFFYYVNSTIAGRRDTIRKLIVSAGNHFYVNENPRDFQLEMLTNETNQVTIFTKFFSFFKVI